MNHAIAIVAAAGLTSAAHAQNTRVIFEGSLDQGRSWSSGTLPYAGGDVLVRMRVQLVNAGTNTVLGVAGCTLQPKLSGFNPGAGDRVLPFTTSDGSGVSEEPQTNLGRILPFASAGMGPMAASGVLTWHIDPGNMLRFAGANCVTPTTNVAWGVGVGQLPQLQNPTAFRTGTDIIMFRYGVNLSTAGGDFEWIATVDPATVLQSRASWYRTPNGVGNLLAPMGDVTQNIVPLRIVIPTPGGAALLALAGITIARRRRAPA